MSQYAVITQNDESDWDDIKGDLYNYPSRYRGILSPGCRVIYYKGKQRNAVYASDRLSPDPHYFGVGVIGDSIEDPDSDKNDWYCEIIDYQEFEEAVPFKIGNDYLETIPENLLSNYWRYGVREIVQTTYDRILGHAKLIGYKLSLPNPNGELESYQLIEGNKRVRFSTYYERNPFYRTRAIEIHQFKCMACEFDFEAQYGELGKGYIQVHHNKPISETGPTSINPETDLSVLCANCHAMVHRRKNETLSVDLLREIVQSKYR